MLLRAAYTLTALTGLLVLGGGAGLVFNLAPYDQMAWVLLAALGAAVLAFFVITIGIAANLSRRS